MDAVFVSANDQKLVTTLLRDINALQCNTSNAFHDAFEEETMLLGCFSSQSIKR